MEKRKFGKTGLETSALGFGGFHLLEIPVKDAGLLLNTYLDAGGNYIETAAAYGDGESELKIGKTISARRKEYILATKTGERKKEGFIASLDRSLRNLNTDYVDLILMHSVGTMEELDTILGPGGAIEGYEEAKRSEKAGFVGISMHGQPDVLTAALKKYPFDAVMSTINYYDRFNFPEIEGELIPLAQEKGTAIILMKPLADGLLWKSAPQAFKYALSQPVSVVVTGMNNMDMLQQDLQYANDFSPITDVELEEIYKDAPELGNYVCRQCKLCDICPEGVPISEIFLYEGYFDRQLATGVVNDVAEYALRERLRFWFGNKGMAEDRYSKLHTKADKCTKCGVCMQTCPYGIDIIRKLEFADYKLAGKKMF
ncbi:MAG: 4Fe-4S binding protein [Clostridiaceae bacterium]|nr:4Fe-4S binding protein [Clostridiaceae bacterium]